MIVFFFKDVRINVETQIQRHVVVHKYNHRQIRPNFVLSIRRNAFTDMYNAFYFYSFRSLCNVYTL